jgi:hypothetical protein
MATTERAKIATVSYGLGRIRIAAYVIRSEAIRTVA